MTPFHYQAAIFFLYRIICCICPQGCSLSALQPLTAGDLPKDRCNPQHSWALQAATATPVPLFGAQPESRLPHLPMVSSRFGPDWAVPCHGLQVLWCLSPFPSGGCWPPVPAGHTAAAAPWHARSPSHLEAEQCPMAAQILRRFSLLKTPFFLPIVFCQLSSCLSPAARDSAAMTPPPMPASTKKSCCT